jgi:hypothetical protein
MLREKKKSVKRQKASIKVIKGRPKYADDPFFIKKEQEAYRALEETPLPNFLLKRAAGKD